MRYLLLGVLVLSLPCAFVHAGEDEAPKAAEDWYRVHVDGVHSGFAHTVTRTIEKDGQKLVETRETQALDIVRMGQAMHMEVEKESWEKPDGTLMRVHSVTKQAANETVTTFTFKDGTVKVETSVMGNTRTAETAVDKDLVGPAHTAAALGKLAGTDGETVTLKGWMAEFQKAVTAETTSAGKETVTLHGGKEAELTKVTTVLQGVPGMTPVTWLDGEGTVWKTRLDMMGLRFETLRAASEAEAKGKGETKERAPDMFERTLIKEDDPVPVPRHLEYAALHVTRKDESLPWPDVQANGWHVSEPSGGGLSVKASRTVPPEDKQGVRPLAAVPDELKDALAASSMIQADADAIVAAATRVAGSETNAWKAAQKLERWVFEHMTNKGFGVGFGSASEALETREGDCTEHAVLLAALCRAAGIPARVVMGLEYLAGVWGGHAWNDVWIDGAWYQLDATNGYGYVDPLHLPFAQMVMKEGGQSEFVQMMGRIGNLRIDVRAVKRNGRLIDLAKAGELVTTDAPHHCDRVWGIRFDAPPGFAFDPPGARKGMSNKLMELDGKTAAGQTVEIRVDAMDAPPGGDLDAFVQPFVKHFKLDPSAVRKSAVDGRPARWITMSQGNRHVMRVAVAADDALYVFTLDRAAGEPERQAFEAFLGSVDFDVDTAPR